VANVNTTDLQSKPICRLEGETVDGHGIIPGGCIDPPHHMTVVHHRPQVQHCTASKVTTLLGKAILPRFAFSDTVSGIPYSCVSASSPVTKKAKTDHLPGSDIDASDLCTVRPNIQFSCLPPPPRRRCCSQSAQYPGGHPYSRSDAESQQHA